MDTNIINNLVLAYIGDSVYELYVRKRLVESKINKVNILQKRATNYVSAKGQAFHLSRLLESNMLLDEEIDVVKRARNSKVTSRPKNTDILTYKHATALEALIGYLYLNGKINRIDDLIEYIIGEK